MITKSSGCYSWYQSPYPATPFHGHLHQPRFDPSKYHRVEILLVIVFVNFYRMAGRRGRGRHQENPTPENPADQIASLVAMVANMQQRMEAQEAEIRNLRRQQNHSEQGHEEEHGSGPEIEQPVPPRAP